MKTHGNKQPPTKTEAIANRAAFSIVLISLNLTVLLGPLGHVLGVVIAMMLFNLIILAAMA